MQLAGLVGERRDRDRVLEQPSEVGVVRPTRARRPAPLRAQLRIGQHRRQQPLVGGVVDLAREVLEKPVELVEVPVGGRQEVAGIDVFRPGDVDHLQHQRVPEELDPAAD